MAAMLETNVGRAYFAGVALATVFTAQVRAAFVAAALTPEVVRFPV